MTTDDRIAKALKFAENGIYDGAHHKIWVIDQMVRALTGCPMVTAAAHRRLRGADTPSKRRASPRTT